MKQSVRFVLTLVVCLVLSLSGLLVGIPAARAADTGTWTQLPLLYGGEVRALAVDPVTPTTLYAGTMGGGVFRSTDSGTWWTAIGTGLDPSYVRCLAIDPLTPSTLYASTSCDVFRSTDSGTTWTATSFVTLRNQNCSCLAIDPITPSTLYAGDFFGGVFRSTDSGDSWTAVTTGLIKSYVYFYCLAIDPLTPATLYVGISGGVFRSTDSGDHWTAAYWSDGGVVGAGALAIDPLTPSTLYAGAGGGVFRSTDSGDWWTYAGSVTDPWGNGRNANCLAINPLTPSTLYAATDGRVYCSTDSGTTWVPTNIGLGTQQVYALEPVYTLAIDPLTPSTLYAGTNGGVFRSTDAGTTWSATNAGLVSYSVPYVAVNPITPSILYVGTAGPSPLFEGIRRSSDSGNTWTRVNAGLPASQVDGLVIDPLTPSTVYAIAGDSLYRSVDSGDHWTAVSSNQSVTSLAINPVTPTTLYIINGSGVFRSADSGITWSAVNRGFKGSGPICLAIDPLTPTTVYAGTYGGVFRSSDSGDLWVPVSTGLTNLSVECLTIDPVTPTTLYAGTMGGGVFRSTDSGDTWTEVNTGLTYLYILALTIDPLTPTTVYAGTNGGVFRSANSGDTWTEVNTGLTNLPIYALAIDPLTPATLYAGTEGGGVFRYGAPVSYVLTTAVSPSATGSVARSPDASSYAGGTVVTLTATPFPGYTFSGWSGDLGGTSNPVAIAMTSNRTITATFAPDAYTLTVTPPVHGTVAKDPDQATYGYGTVVTLTATPAAGYTFAGWSGDLSGMANPTTLTMTGNKTLAATFTPIPTYTLTVTRSPLAGGTVARNPDQTSYLSGTVVTLTATSSSGYTFAGWSGDLTGSTNPMSITMSSDKTVSATFAVAPARTLSISVVGSGFVVKSPNLSSYVHGTVVTLTATGTAGYVFTGWSGDLTGSTNSTTITMDGNKTVTATFTANPSLSLSLSAGWNLVSCPVALPVSSIPGLQAVYGYHDGWSVPTTLTQGQGYWVQVQNAVTVPLTGTPSTAPVALTYQAGWQLLGNPFDVPLLITSITNHGLIITCYSYGPNWEVVDLTTGLLQPGKGYWVQLSAPTTLTLTRP